MLKICCNHDLLKMILEFVGTLAAARVSRTWAQQQVATNERILAACRKEPLLQRFFQENVAPTMHELQNHIIALRDRGFRLQFEKCSY